MKKNLLVSALALLALVAMILGMSCITYAQSFEESAKLEDQFVWPEDKYARIVSFGDCLVHKPVFESVYNSQTGTYDFLPLFSNIAHYFDSADIVIGNNESPYAGYAKGYSGYPCFNCPEELAYDLSVLGVDIMSTANNHCLDKGFDGLTNTLNVLDSANIDHVGTARTPEEQSTILYRDLNGIKTAFLSFTYGTNGISLPKGKEYCVNLIDEAFILSQINTARENGAALIVASMHWGDEYHTVPNATQEHLANFMVDNGVNIILGSHPHVLQPMKKMQSLSKIGNAIVIYSQGNFFSAQTKAHTQETAIFDITIKQRGISGEIIVNATYHPVYVQDYGVDSPQRYQLLDLDEIVKSYEDGENFYSESEYLFAKNKSETIKSLIEAN